MGDKQPVVFALSATHNLGRAIAEALGLRLSPHEERDFEDGEHKARPLGKVFEQDVYVVHSLFGEPGNSANDKLCRLLMFLSTVRDAGAARVTAVIPYLAYARKDRRTQPQDPVTSRYVATLIEASGADRVVALEVHNTAAFDNAFRCPSVHLGADPLFLEHFAKRLPTDQPVVVVSPDVGGIKRAERFRALLEQAQGRSVSLAFLEKARGGGLMRPGRLAGDVADASVIIVDDMISTGGTLAHAAVQCKAQGAHSVYAAAAHGLFNGNANEILAQAPLSGIVVSDSVPPFRVTAEALRARISVMSSARLFAAAIHALHSGESGQD